MGRLDRGPDPLHRGLHLLQRAHRLDQEEVHPALGQRGRLLGERIAHFVRHSCAEREEDLARRPHIARDQHLVIGRRGHLRRLDGRQVKFSHTILKTVQPQAEAVAPERVGRDHLGAGIGVGLVDALEHLRRVTFHSSGDPPVVKPAACSIVPIAPSPRMKGCFPKNPISLSTYSSYRPLHIRTPTRCLAPRSPSPPLLLHFYREHGPG